MTWNYKDGLWIVLSSIILVLVTKLGDLVFSTNNMVLLLNVDFIFGARPISFAEEFLYHLLTCVILYYLLKYIAYYWPKLYNAALISVLFMTSALYFILSNSAKYTVITPTLKGFVLWVIAHIIYIISVNRMLKRQLKGRT
ncbi:hypothetical protein [Kurthia sibirica]|uniref:Uncharacterized protein n=1 Tax=Kurthia sibirica TaxID=202750 RepID=A0A2U3AIL8_9BACL|nr:hypothetical protein [Kurthia sibirica]PWI24370.1 hypothetical protein DEX24_13620 [Kurthia sibirica]GEK33787.1 hypothetical protein KSI01_13200 [Kurthia sibirica]